MFKSKLPLYLFAILFCVLTVSTYREMSPWFWVFLFGSIILGCLAVGSTWAIRSAIWFGAFFATKMLTHNGFIAFIVASIASHIAKDLLRMFSSRKNVRRFHLG